MGVARTSTVDVLVGGTNAGASGEGLALGGCEAGSSGDGSGMSPSGLNS
jgi:hypothetical protein